MASIYRIALILFFSLPSISFAALSCYAGGITSTQSSDPSTACKNLYAFQGGTALDRISATPNTNTSGGYSGNCQVDGSSYFDSLYCTGTIDLPTDCGSKIGDTSHSGEQLTGSGSHCPSSLCIGGCTYSRTGLCGIVGGTDWTALVGVGQGTSCTADNPPPVSPCPVCDCLKAGKSWGTVNGVTVCVNAGSSGSNPVSLQPPPTTTTPAPTTENPTPTPVTTQPPPIIISSGGGSAGGSSGGNNSGSGSSAGSGGSGTVTTTNPDGSTTNQPMSTFCEQNPTAAICKEADKGSFGGSCGAFTCDGNDAIACAVALEQHNRACQFYQANEPLNSLASDGSKVMDGTANLGGVDTFAHPTEFNVGSLDETSFLPKQCLPDMMFQIMNQTITLPLSRLCDGLQSAGKIVLAFAFVVAARILFS